MCFASDRTTLWIVQSKPEAYPMMHCLAQKKPIAFVGAIRRIACGRSSAALLLGAHTSVCIFCRRKSALPVLCHRKPALPLSARSHNGYPCTAFPIHLRLAGTALRRYRLLLPLLNFCLKPVIICQEFFQPCIGQRMVQRFLQHRVWHRCDVRSQAGCFHNVHRMAK